ncbi:very-long-chain (3R)-3-hydroxyacyl-CoA dehydratase-like isoform X2 [Colletes gigas]|uniref:very-long-chain (3R)-3-hydroxyacyl-CoA dehydratase-like isoform X2 n=1 Tax=Colletes gigas TaxID=935657 RepID=UPI001C9AB02C|nr:very-long-chain (3R)-3-hydroxyacyl-CoA dehydratase-like isoform X2 [Colletes gigas]
MTNVLTPFVYWAQTKSQVTLRVDLTDVKDLNVNICENKLQILAYGHGVRGLNNYGFSLHLHSSINTEESDYKVIDRQIDVTLKKNCPAWWPRLISQPQKPSWLKIDFTKWTSQDFEDNDDEKRDICNDYPGTYDKLHQEEFGYKKEDFKKVYLIIYNLCQFVGFLYILTIMGIMYSRDGPVSMKETYMAVGNPIKFIQLLQFLEVMHALFGYTKGSALMSFVQVGGRAFILFSMIEAEPRMQTKPVVFYLFLVWSTVEIVRYPYYIMQLLNIEISFLTWLRYTIWMPLYPLGFLCEGIIILRNIPYFEETLKFSLSLPNSWNLSFHFPSFLKIYLLVFCLPLMYMLMTRMNKVRYTKLGMSKLKRYA